MIEKSIMTNIQRKVILTKLRNVYDDIEEIDCGITDNFLELARKNKDIYTPTWIILEYLTRIINRLENIKTNLKK